jgi:hypothetical protein
MNKNIVKYKTNIQTNPIKMDKKIVRENCSFVKVEQIRNPCPKIGTSYFFFKKNPKI